MDKSRISLLNTRYKLPRLDGDAPFTARRDRRVVGDQHQRGAQFLVQLEHQLHHGLAGGEVQAAGRLVGQQHGWLDDKGARQRHALLFAARQHLGVVAQALGQADPLEHVGGQRACLPDAREFQRQHDVFKRRQIAHELKALEDKTHFLRAQGGAVVLAEREQILPRQPNRALAGRIEPGNDGQQRAFAGARGTDNGGCLAGVQR